MLPVNVIYFFDVLRDPLYEEALIAHSSKIEFFARLAAAAEACLLEQPDATAHLVCAASCRNIGRDARVANAACRKPEKEAAFLRHRRG